MRIVIVISAALALSAAACGGSAVPQPELVSAKSSLSAAEAVGAKDEPSASLHLKLATDNITNAERLIEEGKNDEARELLERARADAELALALANEAKTRQSAQEAIDKVKAVQASGKEGTAS